MQFILRTLVASPIQNLQVAQATALDMRHVKDIARDVIKKVKIESSWFDGWRYLNFFLDWLGSWKNNSTNMICQMHKRLDFSKENWMNSQKYCGTVLMSIWQEESNRQLKHGMRWKPLHEKYLPPKYFDKICDQADVLTKAHLGHWI